MANTRFKGANSSERLTLLTLSDSDMFQTRHLPGTVNDADKGVSKSLLQALPVAVCATAAATAAKVMTLAPESCPDFTLVNGRVIHVYFSAANTASTPTANVAGTGAIPIVYPSGDFVGNWAAGVTMDLMYISITVDNTAIERWVVVSSLPVDTVAVDNMNSVTSNAVAKALPKVLRITKSIPFYSDYSYRVTPSDLGLTTFDNAIVQISATAWENMVDISEQSASHISMRVWQITTTGNATVSLKSSGNVQMLFTVIYYT